MYSPASVAISKLDEIDMQEQRDLGESRGQVLTALRRIVFSSTVLPWPVSIRILVRLQRFSLLAFTCTASPRLALGTWCTHHSVIIPLLSLRISTANLPIPKVTCREVMLYHQQATIYEPMTRILSHMAKFHQACGFAGSFSQSGTMGTLALAPKDENCRLCLYLAERHYTLRWKRWKLWSAGSVT